MYIPIKYFLFDANYQACCCIRFASSSNYYVSLILQILFYFIFFLIFIYFFNVMNPFYLYFYKTTLCNFPLRQIFRPWCFVLKLFGKKKIFTFDHSKLQVSSRFIRFIELTTVLRAIVPWLNYAYTCICVCVRVCVCV